VVWFGAFVAAHVCFWRFQAAMLSKSEEPNASNREVKAILNVCIKKLGPGDADDLATLESLAAAIGPASELSLLGCK
jgi:hypothetical protein